MTACVYKHNCVYQTQNLCLLNTKPVLIEHNICVYFNCVYVNTVLICNVDQDLYALHQSRQTSMKWGIAIHTYVRTDVRTYVRATYVRNYVITYGRMYGRTDVRTYDVRTYGRTYMYVTTYILTYVHK